MNYPLNVVSPETIRAAADRLRGVAIRTPLLTFPTLDKALGARVFVKAELLQHCGAFKFRGAYNSLAKLSPEQRARGVVAWSSGNHAQGVAMAAGMFDMPATIVMPQDAPEMKLSRTRALGAEVVEYDRYTEDREAIARKIASDRGAALIPSYEYPGVIEGQGTVAVEVCEDLADLGVRADVFLTPCGGGGLAAGCMTYLRQASSNTEFWVAEPERFDGMGRSLAGGAPALAPADKRSICDAILTPIPGELTFGLAAQAGARGTVVCDDEVLGTMSFAFRELKLVVEPGGAAGLAALLSGKIPVANKNVVVVLSGGNVDPALFARALETPPLAPGSTQP